MKQDELNEKDDLSKNDYKTAMQLYTWNYALLQNGAPSLPDNGAQLKHCEK